MDASNFWEVMDTNEFTKDQIELLARHLVDAYGKHGCTFIADNFIREAKFNVSEALEGSYKDYHEKMAPGAVTSVWISFCQEKLNMKGLKQETSQVCTSDPETFSITMGNIRVCDHFPETTTNQQPLGVEQDRVFTFPCHKRPWLRREKETFLTTTNQQPLDADRDHGTISGPKEAVLKKLQKCVSNYFNANAYLADHLLKKKETDPAGSASSDSKSSGSRKRKLDFQLVKA